MKRDIKYRHELKYQCSIVQLQIIKSRLDRMISIDKNAPNGHYLVRSMYFDNYANRCYYENEIGASPREKFRIRIYNASDEKISLECKRKERGKIYKTSCCISKEQFYALTNNRKIEDISNKNSLLQKFYYLMKTELFRPVIIVEYDRIPYVYKDGNVRITIDKNIRSTIDFEHFFESNLSTRDIMLSGQHLLEVKFDEFLPDFIKETLELSDLRRTTFSKYYLCRKFSTGGRV